MKSRAELVAEITVLRQRLETARLKELHLLDQVIALREELAKTQKVSLP